MLTVDHVRPRLFAALPASGFFARACLFCARNATLVLLACAATILFGHRCHAQNGATAVAQRLNLAPHARHAPVFPFVWPARFVDPLARATAPPAYASISEFLHRTPDDARSWNTSIASTPASRPVTTNNWRDFGAAKSADSAGSEANHGSLAEQRPDLQDGNTGEGNVVRFIHYRLPWLVTPEAAIHALPTVSVRAGEAVRLDLTGGVIGGRSGAYGQLVIRF